MLNTPFLLHLGTLKSDQPQKILNRKSMKNKERKKAALFSFTFSIHQKGKLSKELL